MATETELKLRIAPDAIAALSRHPALRPLKRGRSRTVRLTSTYFDTPDDALVTRKDPMQFARRWQFYDQAGDGLLA